MIIVTGEKKRTGCLFFLSPSRRSMKGPTINCVTCEGVAAEFIYLGTLISNDNSVQKKYKVVPWPAVELILQL